MKKLFPNFGHNNNTHSFKKLSSISAKNEKRMYRAINGPLYYVQAGGIEPPTPPWRGGILPLNHARIDTDTVTYNLYYSI